MAVFFLLLAAGVDCPPEVFTCHKEYASGVSPLSYTIPQGFHRLKANRSYEDHLYTANKSKPFVPFWKWNTTKMVWLYNGTGQLTDGKCGSEKFRDPISQYPWLAWNTNYIPQPKPVRQGNYMFLFFFFDKPTTFSSVSLHLLNAMDSGVAAHRYVEVHVSNESNSQDPKALMMQSSWSLVGAKTPLFLFNKSKKGVVVETIDLRPSAGHVVRLRLMSYSRFNHSWIMVSEVHFCANST